MKPNPVHRLPAPLEAAAQSLKLAARSAVERTIESLGLAALAAGSAYQRDGLLGAQFELNRKSAVFVLTFNEAFDTRVMREAGLATAPDAADAAARWDALSLVDDSEVEAQIAAERFGMDVAHSCDWELREFNGFVAALLGVPGGAPAGVPGPEKERHNPLRPEVVGHALMRGIDAVSERPEVRKVLQSELGRSLGSVLRGTYAEIVADLRRAGVQPLGLAVRGSGGGRGAGTSASQAAEPGDSGPGAVDSRFGGRRGTPSGAGGTGGFGASAHGGASGYGGYGGHGGHGGGPGAGYSAGAIGHVDPALMGLIRRLAAMPMGELGGEDWAAEPAGGWGGGGAEPGVPPLAAPNLIRAHREELRQASRGSLDHMVIDVIGSLFDQILSDPKVPPPMAQQIARLQLPVLRAALGDPSFFSSRRHPVRRFINRIASLGAAFESFDDAVAQRFLATVRALVQEVVEGDFDQIDTYESKLRSLEAFITDQARDDDAAPGQAAELLAQKEDEQRLRLLYAQRLQAELKGLTAPDFVRDFVARIWSQVLMQAALRGGPEGELAQRMRAAGRELFVSVQPKATPAARKAFLAELPKLMQTLTEGMDLIGWPAAQRHGFFGQLMPAHAEALKSTGARQLDINLLVRQVDGALHRPPPSRDELPANATALPVLTDEVVAPRLSAAEARQVGLVDEAAVDWAAPVQPELDIDLGELAPSADAAPTGPGSTPPGGTPGASAGPSSGATSGAFAAEPSEPADPTHGRALADHVQIGFAYQMQLAGQWQKVRLSHVSPGRSFFVFTHGAKQRETVSLTQRMLLRLCEAGRLRAFESAYLVERATARARRQLAAVSPTARS